MFLLPCLTTFIVHSLGFCNHPGRYQRGRPSQGATRLKPGKTWLVPCACALPMPTPLTTMGARCDGHHTVVHLHSKSAPYLCIRSGVTLLVCQGVFFPPKLRQLPPHPPFLQTLQDTTLWYRGPQRCPNEVEGEVFHDTLSPNRIGSVGGFLGLRRECIHT